MLSLLATSSHFIYLLGEHLCLAVLIDQIPGEGDPYVAFFVDKVKPRLLFVFDLHKAQVIKIALNERHFCLAGC